jgi:hypothetical protein
VLCLVTEESKQQFSVLRLVADAYHDALATAIGPHNTREVIQGSNHTSVSEALETC